METNARYLLIGLFSLVVTLLLLVFVLWLGKLQLDREHVEYDVRFNESVAGLSVGGAVQYHGIQVGEVRRLSLDADDPRQVSAIIRVAADTPIKTDTAAQLSYTGLTGVAVVELSGGSPEAKLLREADASERPRIDSIPSTLSELMSGGSGAVHSAEEVLLRISQVLSDDNLKRVSNLLANLEAVSSSVNEDYPAFRTALADARGLQQRLESALRRADQVLAQLQRELGPNADGSGSGMLREARDAVAGIHSAAAALEQFSRSGERTVSGFDREARSELVVTLQSLRQASENLERITRRFDQQPADYLLGNDALPVYSPENKP